MANVDRGFVIKDASGLYFTGYNNWDEQLRKAQIYHSEKMAEKSMNDNRPHIKQREGKHLVAVEVREIGEDDYER